MATYWISFRIAHSGDYQTRYRELVDGLMEISTQYWEDTTSFLIIESSEDIDGVASTASIAVSDSKDLVLIRAMESKSARLIGIEDDDDVFKLMPYLKYA